jgi:hypothetical protein
MKQFVIVIIAALCTSSFAATPNSDIEKAIQRYRKKVERLNGDLDRAKRTYATRVRSAIGKLMVQYDRQIGILIKKGQLENANALLAEKADLWDQLGREMVLEMEGAAARSEVKKGWIDVLKKIDPAAHTREGSWKFENDGQFLMALAKSTLETPFKLPREYDVQWEFESESTAVNMLLVSPLGKRFEWVVKGWSHRICGIRQVDGLEADANPTTTIYPLENGVRYVVEVRVRKDRFTAFINGKQILDYKTNWQNIEIKEPWHNAKLQPRTLGFWVNKHWTKTYNLAVRPIRR